MTAGRQQCRLLRSHRSTALLRGGSATCTATTTSSDGGGDVEVGVTGRVVGCGNVVGVLLRAALLTLVTGSVLLTVGLRRTMR